MCGIAGFHLKDPDFVRRPDKMEELADLFLDGIKWRGKDATGLVAVTNDGNEVALEKYAVDAATFSAMRNPLPPHTRTLLLHTRAVTQGSPDNEKNNHPVVCNSVYTIHNGSIYNDAKVFEEHDMKREAEVDTEAISAIIDKFGLDNAEEALKHLDGSFAIAAIDPEKHPNKLLLAKGRGTPLCVHESDKFIVWASTQWAITDAWKKVLGTPPAAKSFKHFAEGDLWLVDGDVIEPRRFEVKQRPPIQRSSAGKTVNRGGGTGQRTQTYFKSNNYHPETSKRATVNCREAIKEIREQSRGVARLLVMFKGASPGYMGSAQPPYTWLWCSSCGFSVLAEDLKESHHWGWLCVDCYSYMVSRQPHQNPAAGLTDDEVSTLEAWAKLEAEIHRLSLKEISNRTGLDVEAIDWLIHRVPQSYLDRYEKVLHLAGELDEMYQDVSEKEWKGFGISGPDDSVMDFQESETKSESESQPSQQLVPYAEWNYCPIHRLRTYKAQCGLCIDQGEVDAEQLDERFLIAVEDGDEPTAPKSKDKRCTVCVLKHTTLQPVSISAGPFHWCQKHYYTCGGHGCWSRRNDPGVKGWEKDQRSKTVTTAPDGRRYCHFCSRGIKGCTSDTERDRMGVVVTTLIQQEAKNEQETANDFTRRVGLPPVTLH